MLYRSTGERWTRGQQVQSSALTHCVVDEAVYSLHASVTKQHNIVLAELR